MSQSNQSPSASGPQPGATLDGRYELTRELSRGVFSIVFEARHRHVGRSVVVKIAPNESRGSQVVERLMREARALDAARHPAVVDVLDAGCCPSFGSYLVLEKIEGKSLDGILAARYRLPVDDAVRVAHELCETLSHLHRRGIVHRDIKPSNVFVSWNVNGEECTRLLDLGISQLGAEVLEPADPKLTMVGQVLGTPEYMPPEQLLAQHPRVDARSDVYALGVTLWECLVGNVPVTGSYPEILQFYAQNQRVPSIRATVPSLPAALAAAIDRALSRQPEERFADALAFAHALDAAVPTARRPTQLLGTPHRPNQTRANARAAPAAVPDGAQRRKFPRAPYLAPARLLRSGAPALDGRTEDISEAGTLLVLAAGCQQGEKVQLRFALPTTGQIVTLAAVVRWVREGHGRVAVGLEFDDPPADARVAIARYVRLIGAT